MDIVDISSDSNDTIILPYTTTNDLESIDAICTKYNSGSKSYETNDFYNLDLDEDEIVGPRNIELMEYEDDIPMLPSRVCNEEKLECDDVLLKELYNKYLPSSSVKHDNVKTSNFINLSQSSKCTSGDDSSQKSARSEVENEEKNKQANKSKKQRLEEQHILKQLERAKKKEIKEKEKLMKQAVRTVQRSTSKEECIKNINVRIGSNIIEQDYGETIKSTLKENNIASKCANDFPDFITWTRKIQTLENMLSKETECSEKHCLFIMSSRKFTEYVSQGILANQIQEIITTNFEHITVAIFGINRPNENQELAIIELEMLMKCHCEFFKSKEDLATFVYMVTKAVAQVPYKMEQEAKFKTQNVYFNDSNKDTVPVDKNGNGLSRLWHQMLTMFPLARLETAEAITSVYSTPSALFKAYKDCERKEELLQDLPIRRAQGPLTAVRKIGPELSKKACTFFTSTQNKPL